MTRPITGAWTEHDVPLDAGERLARVTHGWVQLGAIAPDGGNVVVVLHALTGNARVHEWWRALVGEGRTLDPSRVAVVAPDLLGGCGATRAERSSALPDAPGTLALTPRDLARRVWALCDALGITRPLAVVGGSLGGMVALETAALAPGRARRTVVLAAPARQTALGAGWGALMRAALDLGGEAQGLALARRIGMLSYRSAHGLEARFGAAADVRDVTRGIGEWLAHHGRALVARFDAGAYRTLVDAMDRHDVARDRGSLAAALAPHAHRVLGVGIPGDLLYPHDAIAAWCAAAGARYASLESLHGHDGFLLETEAVGALLAAEIEAAEAEVATESTRDAGAPSEGSERNEGSERHESSEAGAAGVPRLDVARHVHIAARADAAPLRIALAGVGVVGDAFAARLATLHAGVPVTLARALVRDVARSRPGLAACVAAGAAPPEPLVTEPAALLPASCDVLVEALGGIEPARTLVVAALRRGVAVVTANKALVAAHGPELVALARAHGTTFDFEGAVAASVPVVRALRERTGGASLVSVRGILNGTTNAVLDAVHGGASLADAIADAQARGFAEADPSRDLDGRDAEDKLRILAWLAFGTSPTSLTVERAGVDEDVARLVRAVRRDGRTVRLIAEVTADGEARIAPQVVALDDAWGRVRGATNRLEVRDAHDGRLVLVGPGAGGAPTAAALWRDVLQPARDRRDYGPSAAPTADATRTSSAAVSMRPARRTCTSSR